MMKMKIIPQLRRRNSKTSRILINEREYRNNQLFLEFLIANTVMMLEMRVRMAMIPQIRNMILVLLKSKIEEEEQKSE